MENIPTKSQWKEDLESVRKAQAELKTNIIYLLATLTTVIIIYSILIYKTYG